MWLSHKIFSILEVAKESVDSMRVELNTLKVERDALKLQLQITQSNFDWLRVQVNTLQAERAALIDRAYGIRVPAPEILRTAPATPDIPKLGDLSSFEHIDEEVAERLGIKHLLS